MYGAGEQQPVAVVVYGCRQPVTLWWVKEFSWCIVGEIWAHLSLSNCWWIPSETFWLCGRINFVFSSGLGKVLEQHVEIIQTDRLKVARSFAMKKMQYPAWVALSLKKQFVVSEMLLVFITSAWNLVWPLTMNAWKDWE